MVKVVRNRSKFVSLFSVVLLSIPFSFVYWMKVWLDVYWRNFGQQKSARERYIDKTSKQAFSTSIQKLR